MKTQVHRRAVEAFGVRFGGEPAVVGYAPGRIEVLGNHTDYNEGFVLSAAIDRGTCFAVSPAHGTECTVRALDMDLESEFRIEAPAESLDETWANYIKGVTDLLPIPDGVPGFNAVVTTDVPLGAGLSSSAALEVSTGLALAGLYGLDIDTLDMARLAQRAENEYTGMRCGLLDQVSSLYGVEHHLVKTDFRTLEIETPPLDDAITLLVCDSGAAHALVDGEYNERREACESAAAYFADRCDHPVTALRDVSEEELADLGGDLDPTAYKRAAHILGENRRVREGSTLLGQGDTAAFGRLMYESHGSSRSNFQNSCPELDVLVEAATGIPESIGARLSGGGFGGSCIVLVQRADIAPVSDHIRAAFNEVYGRECEITEMRPSDGAEILT